MESYPDLLRFGTALKKSLGVQIQNIPLLYDAAPELRDILSLLTINAEYRPEPPLSTAELRTRFFFLVQKVFAVVAETRLLALFLDDIQDAPGA